MYERKAEGAFIRSRRRWMEEGERNTSYFFRLEKNKSKISNIENLEIDGKLSNDYTKIASYCANFYSNMYKSNYRKDVASKFLNSIKNCKEISDDDKKLCDKELTEEEISCASLKDNKSPGNDCITSELYQMFSKELVPFLLKVYIESIEWGSSPHANSGINHPYPKPDKDLHSIDNWRPVCLFNNDYKILTLILAKRIKKTLDPVINEAQSGFMAKRHISINIRLVLDLIDYPELINENSFILFLDFYKAFDSLEHEFIYQSLCKFDFGDNFCKTIKTLYANGNCSIKLKYSTSPRFALSRGISQGCPISPYLFLLSAQLLTTPILQSDLQGVSVAGRHISISPIKSCEPHILYNIPVKAQMNYLGIVITKDATIRCDLNFKPIIEKTQKWFNMRDLTLKGRTLLTKAEGINRLVYAALSLYVDTSVSKEIDRLLFSFLWKNKTHYIKDSNYKFYRKRWSKCP
ncbi:hypothetical protein LDENG_00073330 [Lucifuga dentata]|nr:hypothetical protein LDENG_00073330 [Lucifuga dentata]